MKRRTIRLASVILLALVGLFLGQGQASAQAFAAKVDYGTASVPRAVTTGDFNGDGKLDLAVANEGSRTVSVLLNAATSSQAVNKLIDEVNAASIFVGIARSLIAKLSAAAAAFDRGQTNAAGNQLGAFQNEVRAQSGKTIPKATADFLVAAAQSISMGRLASNATPRVTRGVSFRKGPG